MRLTVITSEDFPDVKLRFKNEHIIPYTFEEDMFWYKDETLEISGYGITIEDMKENMYANIIDSWVYYAICDEKELNKAVMPLRKKLLSILEEN